MVKKPNAAAFLAGMTKQPAEVMENKPALKVVTETKAPAAEAPIDNTKPKRVRRKHFGSYLDSDTLEKAALLEIRLGLDHSGLVKLAIEELYTKHMAKRAFGDA